MEKHQMFLLIMFFPVLQTKAESFMTGRHSLELFVLWWHHADAPSSLKPRRGPDPPLPGCQVGNMPGIPTPHSAWILSQTPPSINRCNKCKIGVESPNQQVLRISASNSQKVALTDFLRRSVALCGFPGRFPGPARFNSFQSSGS